MSLNDKILFKLKDMVISERLPAGLNGTMIDNGEAHLTFADICSRCPALIGQVKDPADLQFAEEIFNARRRYRLGDEQALNNFPINAETKERAKRLPEGLKRVIFEATPILERPVTVRKTALVMHGEVRSDYTKSYNPIG